MTINLKKIRSFLEICFEIAKANFKLKNEGSFLGLIWYILNPLSMFLVILFIKHAKDIKTDIIHYPLYLILGLVLLNFFNAIINNAFSIVSTNANIIRSIKTPLEILITSKVIESLLSHLIEFTLIGFIVFALDVPIWGLVFYSLLLIPIIFFSLGLAFICSIFGAYVKDLKNIWAIGYRLLLLFSPIMHEEKPGSLLYSINLVNPFFYFIEFSRKIIIKQTLPSPNIFIGTITISAFTFFIGLIVFRHNKKHIAELV